MSQAGHPCTHGNGHRQRSCIRRTGRLVRRPPGHSLDQGCDLRILLASLVVAGRYWSAFDGPATAPDGPATAQSTLKRLVVLLQPLTTPAGRLAVRMAVQLPSPAAHSDHVDERERLAVNAVRSYVAAFRQIRGRLFAAYPDLDLVGLADLLTAVRSTRVLPREGRSSTGIDYSVHGAGCRMRDERGTEVDVDLVDGAEAFDGWRVQAFLEGREGKSLSVEELHAACSRLAGWGELREVRVHRWYAL
jgi:hypothetical protein